MWIYKFSVLHIFWEKTEVSKKYYWICHNSSMVWSFYLKFMYIVVVNVSYILLVHTFSWQSCDTNRVKYQSRLKKISYDIFMENDILTTIISMRTKHWTINKPSLRLWVEMNLYANFGTDRFSRLTVMRQHT